MFNLIFEYFDILGACKANTGFNTENNINIL